MSGAVILVSPVGHRGALVLVRLTAVAFLVLGCNSADESGSVGDWRASQDSFLNTTTVCVEQNGRGCARSLVGPVLTYKIPLAIPWRVAAADQNLDGFNDLAVAFGGDWNPQWIVGFSGDTSACNGFWAGASWASEDVGYNSRLRYVDMHANKGVELLASTYFGRRRPGNSGPSGSGLRMYRPPPRQPVKCNSGHLDVVQPEMLIGCAQIADFQFADVDGDGDQDVLAAVHAIDLDCPEVDKPFRMAGGDFILKSLKRLSHAAIFEGFDTPGEDTHKFAEILSRDVGSPRFEERWTVDDAAQTPAQFWHSEEVETTKPTVVGEPEPPEASPVGSATNAEEPVRFVAPAMVPAPKSMPSKRTIEGDMLALFVNEGGWDSPEFSGPSWFGRLRARASRAEFFDIDGDGYLELIVAVMGDRIYAVRGGSERPLLPDRETISGKTEDRRVLDFGGSDGRVTTDLLVALLPRSALPPGVAGPGDDRGSIARADGMSPPQDGERDLHVVLVESLLGGVHSRSQTGQIILHVVGGGSLVLWEGPVSAGHPLSLAWLDRPLDGKVGETSDRLFSPLVLVGRGHWRGKFELAGESGDVLPLWRPEDRRALFEGPVAGLDLEVMGEFASGDGAWTFAGRLKGRAVTLPGVGPIRVDQVRINKADVPPCSGREERCFTFAEGARAVVIRRGAEEFPSDAAIAVEFRSARFQDVAAADSRLGQGAVVAWDARRAAKALAR